MIRGDASEFYVLASDLTQVGAKAVPAMRGVMADVGKATANEWRENAQANVREGHAHDYPGSIDSELAFSISSIAVEVGPNVDKGQGFLGKILEEGGSHNAPQLNGLRAVEAMAPRAERMVDSAMGHLFP